MPTSLLTGLAVGAAGAAGSKIFGNLFGGGDPTKTLQNFAPPGFNGGGISAASGPGGYSISASPERTAAVGGIANTFGQQAEQLNVPLSQVQPGFGALRSSRLAEIENARQASIGNLRENLGRRRVLGSSFAQDAATRTEAEFAQARERTQAESFLQEMQMTQELTQQQFTARRNQFQTDIDEMNLEASIAAGLTGKATDVMGKNAQLEAMLQSQSQQGAGKFFGQALQGAVGPTGKAIGGFFSGGGSGGGGFYGGSPSSNPNLIPV